MEPELINYNPVTIKTHFKLLFYSKMDPKIPPHLFEPKKKPDIPDINTDLYIPDYRLHRKFYCNICLDIMKNASQINCTHAFCYDCIKTWWNTKNLARTEEGQTIDDLDDTQVNCPVCNRTFDLAHIIQCAPLNEIIKELRFSCPNSCGQTITQADLKDHIKTCENRMYRCHYSKDCPTGIRQPKLHNKYICQNGKTLQIRLSHHVLNPENEQTSSDSDSD